MTACLPGRPAHGLDVRALAQGGRGGWGARFRSGVNDHLVQGVIDLQAVDLVVMGSSTPKPLASFPRLSLTPSPCFAPPVARSANRHLQMEAPQYGNQANEDSAQYILHLTAIRTKRG
jgi:hypothetical protein